MTKQHTLEEDWKRATLAWDNAVAAHPNPTLVIYLQITDLRKQDRSIDNVLRRILDSGHIVPNPEKYNERIGLAGAPTHLIGRSPFRYDGKLYPLIMIKTDKFMKQTEMHFT